VRGDKKRRWWRGKRGKPDEGKQPEREPALKEGTPKKSETPAGQPGIAEPALEAFVLDVVNADDRKIDDGTMYFFSRHPAFFPTKDKDIEAVASLARRNPTLAGQLRSEFPRMYHRGLVRDLCEGLRSIWRQAKESSAAEREFFGLHSLVHRQTDIRAAGDRTLQPPSAHAPIHQALRWVRQHLPKLRKCKAENCPHPYFVAAGKQQYCSRACAHTGETKSKAESWAKHKQEWRRSQTKGTDSHEARAPDPEQC
jgi:hypothetical protein